MKQQGIIMATGAVVGTHPIPQNYYDTHRALGTWDSPDWRRRIERVLTDEATRRAYD